MKELSLPDTKLLAWSDEDRSVHPKATKLGADLSCGKKLYKDLQTKYEKGNVYALYKQVIKIIDKGCRFPLPWLPPCYI